MGNKSFVFHFFVFGKIHLRTHLETYFNIYSLLEVIRSIKVQNTKHIYFILP